MALTDDVPVSSASVTTAGLVPRAINDSVIHDVQPAHMVTATTGRVYVSRAGTENTALSVSTLFAFIIRSFTSEAENKKNAQTDRTEK